MIKKSSKISTLPHPQNLKVIMGKPDKVSERRVLEEKKNIFILKERAVDVWEDKMKFANFTHFPPLCRFLCST
jgi:hypothetical protein